MMLRRHHTKTKAAEVEAGPEKPLDELSKGELSAKAAGLGLPKSGSKAALLARILDHLDAHAPADPEDAGDGEPQGDPDADGGENPPADDDADPEDDDEPETPADEAPAA